MSGVTSIAPADLLVVADRVITMAAEGEPSTASNAIAVHGDRIVAVGRADELRERCRPAAEVGGRGLLAVPGFVNAHQHLTGDRLIRSTIPDDLESSQAIFDWAIPIHRAHRPDDDELSAVLSLVEAVCNGITFTVEAGTVAHPDRVLRAYERVGVGGTLGSWGSDADGVPWAAPVDEVIDRQRAVLSLTDAHPSVHGWVTLVGHDLMSDELVTAASALARDAGTGLTFHLSPTDADRRAYTTRTGRAPLVHLEALGCLGRHVLVAHAVHVDDAELDTILRREVAVASCPWAYLRLGQGFTGAGRHAELVERGGRVALGCDSENAGDAIDVLRVAALTAGLAKDTRADPTSFGAHDAFELATRAGAEAIGMAHEIGSIEAGKRADIVLVDTTGPEWMPLADDRVRQLVWASDGRAVRHVIAAGRVVVRDREPTLVDRAGLVDEARESRARLLRDAGLSGDERTRRARAKPGPRRPG